MWRQPGIRWAGRLRGWSWFHVQGCRGAQWFICSRGRGGWSPCRRDGAGDEGLACRSELGSPLDDEFAAGAGICPFRLSLCPYTPINVHIHRLRFAPEGAYQPIPAQFD
jgi:hypothetical protein